MDFAFTKGARELFTYEEGQSRISCVLEYKRYGWGWLLPFHLYWNMNAMVGGWLFPFSVCWNIYGLLLAPIVLSYFLCVKTVPSLRL